jgi:RimJ/RimL family protein N-acetyltransferase
MSIELPTLADGQVILRPARHDDLPAIEAGMHDSDVLRWIGPAWPTDEVLARNEVNWANGSPSLAICRAADDACVGMVWVNVREPDRSIGYVGYWLLPEARGRGLATTAVKLISAWALRTLPISAVRLQTAPDNIRSQRVAERSGFRQVPPRPDGQPVDATHPGDFTFELEPEGTPR